MNVPADVTVSPFFAMQKRRDKQTQISTHFTSEIRTEGAGSEEQLWLRERRGLRSVLPVKIQDGKSMNMLDIKLGSLVYWVESDLTALIRFKHSRKALATIQVEQNRRRSKAKEGCCVQSEGSAHCKLQLQPCWNEFVHEEHSHCPMSLIPTGKSLFLCKSQPLGASPQWNNNLEQSVKSLAEKLWRTQQCSR